MPLRQGSATFAAIKYGASTISAVYQGTLQIWPEGTRISAVVSFAGDLSPTRTTSSTIAGAFEFAGTVAVGVRVVGDITFTHSVTPRATLYAALSGALAFDGVVESGGAFTDGFSLGFDGGRSPLISAVATGAAAFSGSLSATRKQSGQASASITFNATVQPDLGDFSSGFDAGYS